MVSRNIFHLLLFLILIIFSSFLFFIPVSLSPGPDLTPDQITQARADLVSLINSWNAPSGYAYDIWEELDDQTTPNPTLLAHFQKRLAALPGLFGGCWALPNDDRPIDTNKLKDWMKGLEGAADRDGDNVGLMQSGNIAGCDLEKELDKVEAEAKALIAAWCNSGKGVHQREFCPCLYNCAGTDNTGKVYSLSAYTCNNNCIAPKICGGDNNCVCLAPKPDSKPSESESRSTSGKTGGLKIN